MLAFEEHYHADPIKNNSSVYIGADIGGTNANFGFFQVANGAIYLFYSMHFKSQEISDFAAIMQQAVAHVHKKYPVAVRAVCIAAAGVVQKNRTYVKPTNLAIEIDIERVKQAMGLDAIFLVNDFEIIGFGLPLLSPESVVKVAGGEPVSGANKAVLGAGTGLGKCILVHSEDGSHYIPVASEGGHADFAAHTEQEFELVRFIQKTEKFSCAVSWEQVLSGAGIQRMYAFFSSKNKQIKAHPELHANGLAPDEIFDSRTLDDHSWQTYEWYARFYARCAKNLALDALALGGVFIAGGIASKNLPLFEQKEFQQELRECGKMAKILAQIPIYVITDYNVSLYGAAEYLRVQGLCGAARV